MAMKMLVTGVAGYAAKKYADNKNEEAESIYRNAKEDYEESQKEYNKSLRKCENVLIELGSAKRDVLENSMHPFIGLIENIDNFDMCVFYHHDDLDYLSIDTVQTVKMAQMCDIYSSAWGYAATGAASGMLLSLATNGSLSLITGDLKKAGKALLNGNTFKASIKTQKALWKGVKSTPLTAMIAPAVAFTSISINIKAAGNLKKAEEIREEVSKAIIQFNAAKNKYNQIYDIAKEHIEMIGKLQRLFQSCLQKLKIIISYKKMNNEGCYSVEDFSKEELEAIQVARMIAGALKKEIDVPLLNHDGEISTQAKRVLSQLKKPVRTLADRCYKITDKNYALIGSEEEKRKDYAKICLDVKQYDCEELWNMYKDIQSCASIEFRDYRSIITLERKQKENQLIPRFDYDIDHATVDTIKEISITTQKEYYTQEFRERYKKKALEKKIALERSALDKLLSTYAYDNRQEMYLLRDVILKKDYEEILLSEYENKVINNIIRIENQELERICEYIDNQELDEVLSIEKTIRDGGYLDQATSKYYDRIEKRKCEIHVHNMEKYVSGLSNCNREELTKINEKISLEECDICLKYDFIKKLEQRKNEIDYAELCDITSNLGELKPEDIINLTYKIEFGIYNKKLINPFMCKVRVAYENKMYIKLQDDIGAVSDKNGYISLEKEIKSYALPDRIVNNALKAIKHNIFVCDLHSLINKSNDFDQLDLVTIIQIKKEIENLN